MAFFDTMQDFCKEKCNIYLVFNKCLHIKQPFVGAHIVFITRGRVGERDERQLKNGRTQMEQIQQILVGYLKGLRCFWDILGKFWEVMRGWLAAYTQDMNTNKQPHPHPLPAGEGSEYPCFLLEDGARRPRPTMICLAYHMNSSLFVIHSSLNHATVLL